MKEANNPIKSVQKSIQILELLKTHDGLALREISNEVELTKGAVHNHLATLEENEFVVQYGEKFHPSLRFFEYGEFVKSRQKIYQVTTQELDQLAEETGQLASLLVEEHGRGIYLYRAFGDQALTLDTDVGTRVHLHNTGLGKSILAHLDDDRVNRIIEAHGLPSTGPNTISNPKKLKDELSKIRERGYALDQEERIEGVCCIAAPVLTKNGSVHGAISLAGPASRFEGKLTDSEYAELVTSAADVIGINLTYS